MESKFIMLKLFIGFRMLELITIRSIQLERKYFIGSFRKKKLSFLIANFS